MSTRDAGVHRIDATEVTRKQYAAWLATNPPTALLPAACAWKIPDAGGAAFPANEPCMRSRFGVCTENCDNHPQPCVDWCSAYAYCTGVGKRLCGRIGGGPTPGEGTADPDVSQWFNACTSGGLHVFPYGGNPDASYADGYDPQKCNTSEHGAETVPVGSLSGCQSSVPGFTGVYDLSGSVAEWEDSCAADTGALDECQVRGGDFASNSSMVTCKSPAIAARLIAGTKIGFRCCGP